MYFTIFDWIPLFLMIKLFGCIIRKINWIIPKEKHHHGSRQMELNLTEDKYQNLIYFLCKIMSIIGSTLLLCILKINKTNSKFGKLLMRKDTIFTRLNYSKKKKNPKLLISYNCSTNVTMTSYIKLFFSWNLSDLHIVLKIILVQNQIR